MNKIPETKEEWDLLPQEVKNRIQHFLLLDNIKAISDSLTESESLDEES